MESEIANIVAKTELGERLDLDKVKSALPNCEYEPEVYFALIYRLSEPKVSILVNASGKIILVGAKSLDDLRIARQSLFNDLTSLGYHPEENEISIQNIVVVGRLNRRLDFQRIMKSGAQYSLEYNPKTFPGIIFRNPNPRFVALIFSSGKVCVVGLKDLNQKERALDIVSKIMDENPE